MVPHYMTDGVKVPTRFIPNPRQGMRVHLIREAFFNVPSMDIMQESFYETRHDLIYVTNEMRFARACCASGFAEAIVCAPEGQGLVSEVMFWPPTLAFAAAEDELVQGGLVAFLSLTGVAGDCWGDVGQILLVGHVPIYSHLTVT